MFLFVNLVDFGQISVKKLYVPQFLHYVKAKAHKKNDKAKFIHQSLQNKQWVI